MESGLESILEGGEGYPPGVCRSVGVRICGTPRVTYIVPTTEMDTDLED